MALNNIPEERRVLAVDFYCTVARNNLVDRGEIRSLAADMLGIPRPYDRDKVEAIVVYISSHIFELAGMEKPKNSAKAQEALEQLIGRSVIPILLDKSA